MCAYKKTTLALLLGFACVTTTGARSQEAAKPAEPAAGAGQGQLPEVEVIQKKAQPAQKAATKKAPAAKKAPPPRPPHRNRVCPRLRPMRWHRRSSSVSIAPLPGSEVPIEKIPRGVTSLSSADIDETARSSRKTS